MAITIGFINVWDALAVYGISLLFLSIIGVWSDFVGSCESDCNIFSCGFTIVSIIMVLVFCVVSIFLRNAL